MTTYRYGVWLVKGLREFTRSGYEHAQKNFESLEGINMSGRSFLITGANSGLGKETALALAKMGATVHMVCRSEQRGNEAFEEIKTQSGNQEIHLHILDMSEPKKVHGFTRDFVASGKPLNVVVNNAGCMVNTRETTDDGLEKNFATNTLGTYMMTVGLLDHMTKFDSPQVITVTSGGMLLQKLDSADLQFEKMKSFDGTMAYAQNKRQQVVMTDHWSKEYPRVQFTTMHPGWADTPAVRTSMPDFHRRMGDKLRTSLQGADTLIWLCASQAARKQESGGFYQDRAAVSKHLPLAWTKASEKDEKDFMQKIKEIAEEFQQQEN